MIFGGAGDDTIVANFGETVAAGRTTTTSSSATTASSTTCRRPAGAEYGNCSAPTRSTTRTTSTASGRSTNAYSLGGNDTITTGIDAYDIIIGGTGNDTITSGANRDLVFGDNARLTSTLEPTTRNTIYSVHEFSICIIETVGFDDADGGDDTIYGSPFNDILFGGGGDDVIYGFGGNDLIFGDQGKVTCAPGTLVQPGRPAERRLRRPRRRDRLHRHQHDHDHGLGQRPDLRGRRRRHRLRPAGRRHHLRRRRQRHPRRRLERGRRRSTATTSSTAARATTSSPATTPSAASATTASTRACARWPARRSTARRSARTTASPSSPARCRTTRRGIRQARINLLDHSDAIQATDRPAALPRTCLFGNDYIAGGAGADEIWGELGNDVIQGDG